MCGGSVNKVENMLKETFRTTTLQSLLSEPNLKAHTQLRHLLYLILLHFLQKKYHCYDALNSRALFVGSVADDFVNHVFFIRNNQFSFKKEKNTSVNWQKYGIYVALINLNWFVYKLKINSSYKRVHWFKIPNLFPIFVYTVHSYNKFLLWFKLKKKVYLLNTLGKTITKMFNWSTILKMLCNIWCSSLRFGVFIFFFLFSMFKDKLMRISGYQWVISWSLTLH